MSDQNGEIEKRSFPWQFFFLTFAFSWFVWVLAAAAGRRGSLPLIALGGFGPSLVGVALTHIGRDARRARGFWKRIIDVTLIRPGWYAVICLTFPFLMAVAMLVDGATGGKPPGLGAALQTVTQPLAALRFLIIMILGGPLSEELGWRGYALDRLQTRWNALSSSLMLGCIWAVWHLPLFFIKGTSQNAMGFRAAPLVLFLMHILALSVFITWVYNNNGRSTLSAILMHFVSNFTVTIVCQLGGALPLRTNAILTLTYVLAAITVVFIYGPGLMRRSTRALP